MSIQMMTCSVIYVLIIGSGLSYFLRRRELFAPEVFTSGAFMLTVPYYFVVSTWPEKASIYGYFSISEYESTFSIVVIIQIFVYFTVLIGIFIAKNLLKFRGKSSNIASELHSPYVAKAHGVPNLFTGMVLLVSGSALILYIVMNNAGGVLALWADIGTRSLVLAGSGGEYIVGRVLVALGVGIVFLQTFCRNRYYLVFVLAVAVALFAQGVFGARGPVINQLFSLVFLYHYYVSPLSFTMKTLIKLAPLGIATFLFVAVIAAIRNYQMLDKAGVKVEIGFVDAMMEAVSHFSHIETYMFIFDFFNISNLWLGASYKNLAYFVGLIDGGGKIALDDGVYVRALISTGSVSPNELLINMFPSSYPPGLWFGFMQFHFIGLFMFALAVGFVKGYFYKRFLFSGKDLFAFFLMYEVAYNFQPTVYWLLNCTVLAVLYTGFFGAYNLLIKGRFPLIGQRMSRRGRI